MNSSPGALEDVDTVNFVFIQLELRFQVSLASMQLSHKCLSYRTPVRKISDSHHSTLYAVWICSHGPKQLENLLVGEKCKRVLHIVDLTRFWTSFFHNKCMNSSSTTLLGFTDVTDSFLYYCRASKLNNNLIS